MLENVYLSSCGLVDFYETSWSSKIIFFLDSPNLKKVPKYYVHILNFEKMS